jgi:hypothetical protein
MVLRLPFVLWTSTPPHHITAVNDTKFPNWLLTGSSDGNCCCWKKLNVDLIDSPMIPQFLMIPSTCSPVLSIAWATWDERNCAVCGVFLIYSFVLNICLFIYFLNDVVYDNGDLYVWNLSDGSLYCSFPFPCLFFLLES